MFPGVNLEEGGDADAVQRFQVNVAVLEGRHLAAADANSRIIITLGRSRKTSRSRTLRTDCPYFNEFFFFSLQSPLSVFLDEILHVEIYSSRRFKLDKLIGGFSVELATVWLQPNHLFHHKWAVLTDPNNPTAGVRGYLKCDIAILARDSRSKPVSRDPGENIKDHLMVPYGEAEDRQKAKFVFSIFRADNFSSGRGFSAPPDPYVTVTFGGVSRRTSVEKKTETPLWNEELVFVDMIPTLCQYVHIEVCDASKGSAKRVLGGAQLDLREISRESEKGFLPTYGPSFLYFYKSLSKLGLHDKCCSLGHACTYVGRLLMALRTEVVDHAEDVHVRRKRAKLLSPKKIPSLVESQYFEYKEFVFFASVFDVLLFSRRLIGSKIGVRVTIGPDRSMNEAGGAEERETSKKASRPKKKAELTLVETREKALPKNGKMGSGKSWDNAGGTQRKAHPQVFFVWGERNEEGSMAAPNSAASRSGRKGIIRLPAKGFVSVNARRKRIRQTKFLRSLGKWPEKEITPGRFANFRHHPWRRGKMPCEKEPKSLRGLSRRAVAAVRQFSPPAVFRKSKNHGDTKSLLTGKNNSEAAPKSRYLRIKNFLRRDRKCGRLAFNARAQTDDEGAENAANGRRSRISKLKEWTRLKGAARGRSSERTGTAEVHAQETEGMSIPVRNLSCETLFKRRGCFCSTETQTTGTGSDADEGAGSETSESEIRETEAESESSSHRSGTTKCAYGYLKDFPPEKESSSNGKGGKGNLRGDRLWRIIKEHAPLQKLRARLKEEATESSGASGDEVRKKKAGKFVPVRKMNWETSFRRREFSRRSKKATGEQAWRERSSVVSPRKWSPRSGYEWLTSISYRSRNRKEPLGSGEGMKPSRMQKISQALNLLKRRRKTGSRRTERTGSSAASPYESCTLREETRDASTQYAVCLTEVRSGSDSFTAAEESEARDTEPGRARKSLTGRIGDKFLPKPTRRKWSRFRDEDSLPGIAGKRNPSGFRNVEKPKSTKSKLRCLLAWGRKEIAKRENPFAGRGKRRGTHQENRKDAAESDAYAFWGVKPRPPKEFSSSGSYVASLQSDADTKGRRVRRGRRRRRSEVIPEESTDETDFDFEHVRCPWLRGRPLGMPTGATPNRRRKRSRDFAKLGKSAEHVDGDADDEDEDSETTSYDDDRLYTRPKRYSKKRSKIECRETLNRICGRKGASYADAGVYGSVVRSQNLSKPERDDLPGDKAEARPIEMAKKRQPEAMQKDPAEGGQKNFFVFYSLQKEKPSVKQAESKPERKGKEEGGDVRDGTTDAAGEDRRRGSSKAESSNVNCGRGDSDKRTRNLMENTFDGGGSAFDGEKDKESPENEKRDSTKRQKVKNVAKDRSSKGKKRKRDERTRNLMENIIDGEKDKESPASEKPDSTKRQKVKNVPKDRLSKGKKRKKDERTRNLMENTFDGGGSAFDGEKDKESPASEKPDSTKRQKVKNVAKDRSSKGKKRKKDERTRNLMENIIDGEKDKESPASEKPDSTKRQKVKNVAKDRSVKGKKRKRDARSGPKQENEPTETDAGAKGKEEEASRGGTGERKEPNASARPREKTRNLKHRKKGAKAKEEKLRKSKNWLAKRRHEKRKWKALKCRKESDGEPEKATNEIRHLTVYNECNATEPQSVKIVRHYGYSDFSGKFPCLHIVGNWPDARRRMYRANVAQNSVKTFTAGIRDVENELRSENRAEASTKMKSVLGNLSQDCREMLRLTERVDPRDTNLWREKKRFYHGEIGEIILKADEAARRKVLVPEDELNRSYSYLATIQRFAQDPEDSFPDTEIWLLKNKQSVAQHKMRTRKIVHSGIPGERGSKSGKIQSIVFRGKDGGVMAKLEMFMWFGLGSHFEECKSMLLPGFRHSRHACPGTDIDIPGALRCDSFALFQCRIHVSQAVIPQPRSAAGFVDPFVRIVLDGRCRETRTLMSTLNPVWNEMLVFRGVKIHWPPAYVKDNPVAITVEVFDFDFASPGLIGRAVIRPTVKLASGECSSPDSAARFSWEGIRSGLGETGKILIAAELLEEDRNEGTPEASDGEGVLPIPTNIMPTCVGYRLEVLFWGVRELSKKRVGTRCRAHVALECAGKVLTSPSVKVSGEATNFPGVVQILDLELPQQDEYKPPLIVKLSRANTFGSDAFMGTCVIPNVRAFFCPTVDEEERTRKEIAQRDMQEESDRQRETEEKEAREEEKRQRRRSAWKVLRLRLLDFRRLLQYLVVGGYKKIKSRARGTYEGAGYPLRRNRAREPSDWWVKYYASKNGPGKTTPSESLVIYDEELEAQPEFGGFADYICTLNVTAGKAKKKPEKEIFVGKVKAAIKLYKWPLEEHHYETLYGVNVKSGLLRQLPSNAAVRFIVRAYVISCRNLTPKDVFGKSDPYLLLKLGRQKISDRKNYVPQDVNPTFGKCFEFVGLFPKEHFLSVKVMDRGTVTADDLIGETRIDLENRYYTRHHARCGIPATYNSAGHDFWRDAYRPTELLKLVCRRSNMSEPVYTDSGVVVDGHEFRHSPDGDRNKAEEQALNALRKWHEIPFRGFRLVPEHIETRALYHPACPGLEQGKIEMWVDIFPADFRFIPPVVDITPRKPVDMELRAIVWNVENVTLRSTAFFTGEKMSDILVEGWLSPLREDRQATDVHYRSMNGEGNFNWRFVFQFRYMEAERRMVVLREDPIFKKAEETKYPCTLELQVLDNDFFKQDFLGSLSLELSSMPRGAKISAQCDLSMLEEATPRIDLFKIGRTRGWWPFKKVLDEESAEHSLTGKVELELEVLTEEEASQNPAGKGREEPRPLPHPKRPDTSLFWLTNPLKTCRHIICRTFGRYIAVIALTALLILFFGLGLYSVPGYAVKKLLRA